MELERLSLRSINRALCRPKWRYYFLKNGIFYVDFLKLFLYLCMRLLINLIRWFMMLKNKKSKYFGRFFGVFFILNIFVNLVKFENNLYISTDSSRYSNRSEIELVVSERTEYNLSFFKLRSFPKQANDCIFAQIDFSTIHKYWLIHFQNYILIQLKSFNRSFIPNQQLASNLHNLWYHSSFELSNRVIG